MTAFIAPASESFDITDYISPIKVILDNMLLWPLIEGFKLSKDLKIKANKAVDYSSVLHINQAEEYQYYNIESIVDKLEKESSDKVVANFDINLDYKYTFIERKVFNLYGLISELGGLVGIFFPLFAFFSKIFSNRIYRMTLVSSFFKTQNNTFDKNSKQTGVNFSKTDNFNATKDVHINKSNVREEEKVDGLNNSIVGSTWSLNDDSSTVLDTIKSRVLAWSWYKFEWKTIAYDLLR